MRFAAQADICIKVCYRKQRNIHNVTLYYGFVKLAFLIRNFEPNKLLICSFFKFKDTSILAFVWNKKHVDIFLFLGAHRDLKQHFYSCAGLNIRVAESLFDVSTTEAQQPVQALHLQLLIFIFLVLYVSTALKNVNSHYMNHFSMFEKSL